MRNPKIYFYLPHKFWPEALPKTPYENWSGFGLGMYIWTVQTYLWLQEHDFPCHLVNEIPEEGIILADHNVLRTTRIIPSSKQLIICFKEDGLPYPYAQLHVVQNLQDVQIAKGYHYISHWPHPTLIPRDSSRGERFENVAYFGHYNNLVSEFRHSSWLDALAKLELKWCPIVNKNHWSKYQASNASKFEKWNDYSKVDVVLAIRSFGKSKRFVHKPATKLYNAWLAKVPAVLGHESAYYSEGKPGSNYIEATSLEEVLKALELLKDNPKMREKIVQRGWILGQSYTVEKTVDKWRLFLENIAISAFDKWCSKNRRAQLLDLRSKWISFKIRRGISRFISLDEFA